jgi:hypothetical protein
MADHHNRATTVAVVVGMLLATALGGAVAQTGLVSYGAGTHLQTDSGLAVELAQDRELESGNPFEDSETLQLPGGTLSASGSADVTVPKALDQPFTNVTNLDVAGTTVTVNPTDKQAVSVEGDARYVAFRQIDPTPQGDGQTDIKWAGSSGTTNVTITGLSPNTNYIVVENGNELDGARTDGGGTVTFTLPNSQHTGDVQVVGDPPYVQTASPRSGDFKQSRSVTLSARVVDPDGSDVQATIFFKRGGSVNQVAQSTVSSGSTVSASVSAEPGRNEWYVNLESQGDGETAQSSTFVFRTPGFVSIYDGAVTPGTTNLNLINQQVNVTIQSIDSDYRRETTVSAGQRLDLEGAPDERLFFQYNTTDYAVRRSTYDEIGKNRSTVMAPAPQSGQTGDNRTYVQRFRLRDQTGQFAAAESVITFEQYVNGRWRPVIERSVNSNAVINPVLQDEEKYRVRVRNRQGDVRDLGTFEGDLETAPSILTLTVEDARADFDPVISNLGWSANVTRTSEDPAAIELAINTSNDTTINATSVKIYEYNNESNVLYQNDYGLVNELFVRRQLSDEQNDKRWVVKWNGTVDGERVGQQRVVGPQVIIDIGLSAFWRKTFGTAALVVMAGFFGGKRSQIGAVVLPLVAGMLWFIGWLDPVIGGGAIVLALGVGVMFSTARKGVPS